MKRYFIRLLIAVDQVVNVIFGGYPNETLSSRAWRRGDIGHNRYWHLFRIFIDWLFSIIDENHCELSYIYCVSNLQTSGIYFHTYPTKNKPPAVKDNLLDQYSHIENDSLKSKIHLPIDYHDHIDW